MPFTSQPLTQLSPLASEALAEPQIQVTDIAAAQPFCTHRAALERRWSVMMSATQKGDSAQYATMLIEIGNWLDEIVLNDMPILERRTLIGFVLTSVHEKRHTYLPKLPFLGWLGAITDYRRANPLTQQKALFWVAEKPEDGCTTL
jgi:hypothetical protein